MFGLPNQPMFSLLNNKDLLYFSSVSDYNSLYNHTTFEFQKITFLSKMEKGEKDYLNDDSSLWIQVYSFWKKK